MRIVRPIDIAPAALLACNVPEDPPAAWDSGMAYAVDAIVGVNTGSTVTVYQSLQAGNAGHDPSTSPAWWVRLATTYLPWDSGTTYALNDKVLAGHREYQSLQAGNTGQVVTDPSWWQDLGPNNRWRMFDIANSSVTERALSIKAQVQVGGRADAVSLLNIVGAAVRVEIETDDDGVIYDETFDLVSSSGINSWYEYFFEPIVRQGDFSLYDLPLNADPRVRVTVAEPGGTATLGTLLVGQSRNLGPTIHPAKLGIQDFSRKDVDDFGNFTIVKRNFARRATFKVVVEEEAMDAISTLLASYRATAIMWLGVDQYTSSWLYGFYRDFSFDLSSPRETILNLELEGLT